MLISIAASKPSNQVMTLMLTLRLQMVILLAMLMAMVSESGGSMTICHTWLLS